MEPQVPLATRQQAPSVISVVSSDSFPSLALSFPSAVYTFSAFLFSYRQIALSRISFIPERPAYLLLSEQ